MKLSQTLKQKPTVSPQMVLSSELLLCSSLELEQAIAQELAENPALELRDVEVCSRCRAPLMGGTCPTCGSTLRMRETESLGVDGHWGDGVLPGTAMSPDEWDDPVAWLASTTTLAEYVLQQARLTLSHEDLVIARWLVGSLDERGLLSQDVGGLARDIGVAKERVDAVLEVIQTLEPTGVGARDVRECLLIQLKELGRRDGQHSVAERLIADQWEVLGRCSLGALGQEVEASAEEVRKALCFIRESLNPFPAYACWARGARDSSEDVVLEVEPDVIIRSCEELGRGYAIELPKAGEYRLRVRTGSDGAWTGEEGTSDHTEWARWHQLCGRARLFVKSIEQRWRTLQDLMDHLVDYQRDFLDRGEAYLRPLTRAQVAAEMDVHESTISRAVAGKYVQLPSARIVPLEIFFDSAAPVKCLIRELVEQEEEPLSDSALAERLAERGHDVARRTVAKYRNALDILPSSLRMRERELRGVP